MSEASMKRFVMGQAPGQATLFPKRLEDFISDFRKDNGKAIVGVCRESVHLCRRLDLFSEARVAIDESKLKAVNNHDKNFTLALINSARADGIGQANPNTVDRDVFARPGPIAVAQRDAVE